MPYLLVWIAFTSCERSPDDRAGRARLTEGTVIAVIAPSEGHPQAAAIRGGAQRYFAGLPTVRGECVSPRENTDLSLRAAVRRVLEQRPRAVCLFVADPEVARASIALIASEKIPLVTMGRLCRDRGVFGHVGVDLPEGAAQLGANLERIAAGRRSYLLLHESGRDETATNGYRRFMEVAERQFDLTLLQQEGLTPDERAPAEQVEELLRRFPHAGLVVTLNSAVWLTARAGWDERLHQLNRDFRFATLSAAPPLWPRLGTPAAPGDAAALVGPLDGDIGYAAAELAVQALVSAHVPTTQRSIPCELVTAENLPDFARRYAAAANGLDVSAYLPREWPADSPRDLPRASRRELPRETRRELPPDAHPGGG